MKRTLLLSLSVSLLSGCLSVGSARENAALAWCQFEERCGNIGSGKSYVTKEDCLTGKRADWLRIWPTDTCEGRLNAQNYDVCVRAIANTQCDNVIDALATLSKCEASDVCSAR